MTPCRHQPSLRERADIKPRAISPTATATAHDCLLCGGLVYRVHQRPDLKAVARYNAIMQAIPDGAVKELSKTEKRNHTLDLLRTLPHTERSPRRREDAA